MMDPIPVLALLGILIWIVDRILLRCELRGWITYRRMPRVRHGYGNALLGLDALLQPDRRHVIELKQEGEVYKEDDDEGGDDGQDKITIPSHAGPDHANRDPDRAAPDRGTRKPHLPAPVGRE